MPKAVVYNQIGEKVSEVDLNPKIFALKKIDPHLVHFAIRSQRNNLRHAIAHTKNRGEVAGSGKKPWKQKGTGRARAGSIRSPLWRGGGVTFGPRSNRNYAIKINRDVFRKALFTVLSDKVRDNKLIILDNLDASKTRELNKKITDIGSKAGLGKKYALVFGVHNKNLERSGRNIPNLKVLAANQLNVFDLLKYDLILTRDALDIIEKTYLK